MKLAKKVIKKKKYKSLLEFALFGEDDELIDPTTLIAVKKENSK